jgi:hypothetical protein
MRQIGVPQPTRRREDESLLGMRRNWLSISTLLLGAALLCVPASAWSQQTTSSSNSAKQDMKDAGHHTKDAAKDAGRGVKNGSKKAYNKTKHGTRKAWNKTKSTTKGAANGAKQGAQQPQ